MNDLSRRYLTNFDTSKLPCRNTSCLVVGGGIAGLMAAWNISQAGQDVILVVKGKLNDSNSNKAQGGIAAAVGADDSAELHVADTLVAGAGLCDEEIVKIVVEEGQKEIKRLIKLGVEFDKNGNTLSLGREGCHSRSRILHANGDSTGAQIVSVMVELLKQAENVTILEEYFSIDLLVEENVCQGMLVLNQYNNQEVIWAKAIVLSTGGLGQLYNNTTNPAGATADGIAMAYRAGAVVMDMEFVQFHPTAMAVDGLPNFLISEAVRGEGAILRNAEGERFMTKYHSMAELAPRDIVARAIVNEMNKTKKKYVLLDLSTIGSEKILQRFPMINKTCLEYGIDITKEAIPVAPAAHYMMGGVRTNQWGQTNIKRLYCIGESACTGLHGANRLASNSLLEGLVFGKKIVQKLLSTKTKELIEHNFGSHELNIKKKINVQENLAELKSVMSTRVGIIRDIEALNKGQKFFVSQNEILKDFCCMTPLEMETINMIVVGELICRAAIMRAESRGGHFRQDCPKQSPFWQHHILQHK